MPFSAAFGSVLINENKFTWAIHLLWLRWHNYIAQEIQHSMGHLSDETIYLEARKLTLASMQHIIVNEWIPVLLGETLSFNHHQEINYQAERSAQISEVFEAVVPIYLYSLMTPSVFKVDPHCTGSSNTSLIRTCNAFNTRVEGETDQILAGMLLQSAKRDDHTIIEDIRRYAKGPIDLTRQDGVAINIQQTRDFSMADYLSIRQQLGMNTSYDSFPSLASHLWPFSKQSDQVWAMARIL